MGARRIFVFFYGLFMDEELLRTKGAHPTGARIAAISGFALRIGKRATLVRDPASSVYGIVMELSHDDIQKLYAEPSVSAYRPEAVLAQFKDGSFVSALCFNLAVPPSSEEANPEYAGKLRALAGKLNLPPSYTDSIK